MQSAACVFFDNKPRYNHTTNRAGKVCPWTMNGFLTSQSITGGVYLLSMRKEPTIRMFNADCMEAMAAMRDKQYDLAIVDPPYGLDKKLSQGGGRMKNAAFRVLYEKKDWDALPEKIYWQLLFEKTKNQCVFGANYFLDYLRASRGMICWDKLQSMPTMSAWELVWTSFDKPAKIYKQSSMDITRFHPTQKPVALYKWILTNYAKPGQTILDTHGGSGSICIACYDLGFDLDWYELDKEYYDKACERFERHKQQQRLL